MKPIFSKIGKYLKEKRIAKGLSQHQVAAKLGYGSSQFVSNVERGMCGFPLVKLRKLVDIYELDAEFLANMIVDDHARHVRTTLIKAGKSKRA